LLQLWARYYRHDERTETMTYCWDCWSHWPLQYVYSVSRSHWHILTHTHTCCGRMQWFYIIAWMTGWK